MKRILTSPNYTKFSFCIIWDIVHYPDLEENLMKRASWTLALLYVLFYKLLIYRIECSYIIVSINTYNDIELA